MAVGKGEYIIEFVPVGNSMKVSVFDTETLTEVSIVGPVKASRLDLQKTAIQKMHYVLEKNKAEKIRAAQREPNKKRGIIV
ncbi:hypothetical protein A9Q83_14445 [Alphaproteobacteria bacterium 46_93_T64]|nr:hypothetical protein A9Q83_14445 [Alphaproteobacteria bacterium 46_93_T64]